MPTQPRNPRMKQHTIPSTLDSSLRAPMGDYAIIKANITNCHQVAVPDENTIECTWRREKDIFTKRFMRQDDQFTVKNLQHSFEGELLHEALFPLKPFDWNEALKIARARVSG